MRLDRDAQAEQRAGDQRVRQRDLSPRRGDRHKRIGQHEDRRDMVALRQFVERQDREDQRGDAEENANVCGSDWSITRHAGISRVPHPTSLREATFSREREKGKPLARLRRTIASRSPRRGWGEGPARFQAPTAPADSAE